MGEKPGEPQGEQSGSHESAAPGGSSSPILSSGLGSAPGSVIAEPVAALFREGLLKPPPRPGLVGTIGHFELIGHVGSGSMGAVFLARDVDSGQKVALKILRPEFQKEPAIRQRFLLEARRLQLLKHPHLVPVLEVCDLPNAVFFSMPYFERGSLAQELKEKGPLSPQEILQITSPIAEALSFAHSKGIIHRDIKPANILLGANGTVCLADFGLARTLFNDVLIDVEHEQCEGTAPYMSPAVAAGEAEDTRCDIYALGAVIYEMLTGRRPYEGTSTRHIRDQIKAAPPKPIRDVNPTADPQLAEVAEFAMAREHRHRYANMGDLAADLKRAGESEPIIGPHGTHSTQQEPASSFATEITPVLLVGLLALCLVVAGFFSQSVFVLEPVRSFQSMKVNSWAGAVPAEFDGQPGKELLVTDDNELFEFDATGALQNSLPCDDPKAESFYVSGLWRPSGSDFDQALVSWTYEKRSNIGLINSNFKELKRFSASGSETTLADNGAGSSMIPLGVLPADEAQDGSAKLITAEISSFNGGPRALCCYELNDGVLRWATNTGAYLRGCALIDLDGDGFKDLVCGSIATDNGCRESDGTDDSHAYVLASSASGARLWKRELGGVGAAAMVQVLKPSGSAPELLAWVHTGEDTHVTNAPFVGHILKLNTRGGIIAETNLHACIETCLVADLSREGHPEILCSDCDGFIHVLGPDLVETQRKIPVYTVDKSKLGKYGYVDLRLLGTAKLLKGKNRQIVATLRVATQKDRRNPGDMRKDFDPIRYDNVSILVLDSSLHVIVAKRDFAPQTQSSRWEVKLADMDGDGLDEILSLSDRVDILKLTRR